MGLAAGRDPRRPASVRTEAQQPREECCSETQGACCPGCLVSMVSIPTALGTTNAQILRRRALEVSVLLTMPSPSQSHQEACAWMPRSLAHLGSRLCGRKAAPALAGAGTSCICCWQLRADPPLLSEAHLWS